MIPIKVDLKVELAEQIDIEVKDVIQASPKTQSKTVVPSPAMQTVFPDTGYLLDSVIVEPIPKNYGLITYNGAVLTVS